MVAQSELDLVRVHNFFQVVPLLRRDHPNLKINLHMHCEWLNQLDERLVAQALDESDFLSGCSHFIADRIREKFPQHARKTFGLQNGADTALFTPTPPQDRPVLEILYIGRVSPEKGIHVLLQAFQQLRRAVPAARLTILGSRGNIYYDYICNDPDPLVQELDGYLRNDRAYQRELDRLAAESGAVEFVSDMPQSYLTDRMRRCDIFVFPSIWNEPFGMPAIEAMACGKPVVTTHSGGIPEFVSEGQTGRLVGRGNVEALAEVLIELARNPAERVRLGENARDFVQRNMAWEHVVQRLLRQVATPVRDASSGPALLLRSVRNGAAAAQGRRRWAR
jgi:glycosyltransferase involved in cell wall biosynthesis